MESRLRKHPATTEAATPMQLPEAFAANGNGLPVKLFTLRQKLYEKAKREPTFRFYTLYGLIARLDVLEAAWALVAANGGAPGVDGVTIQQVKTSPDGDCNTGRPVARRVADAAVQASSGATGIHSKSQWPTTAPRDSHGPGSRGADGRQAHSGADL